MLPTLQGVGTVGHKTGFHRPGAWVRSVLVGRFHRLLLHRKESRECHQSHHIAAGSSQGEGNGIVVLGFYFQLPICILGKYIEEVSIIRSRFRIRGTLPGIDEVIGIQAGTV